MKIPGRWLWKFISHGIDAIYSHKNVPAFRSILQSPSPGCIMEATGFPEALFHIYQVKQESHLRRKWSFGRKCALNTNSTFSFSDKTFGLIREEKSEWWVFYICPSIRMEKAILTGNNFLEFYISIIFFFLEFASIFRFGFKLDTNHPLFRRRHIYIYMIGFYNRISVLCEALKIKWRIKHFSFYRTSRILRQLIRVLLGNQICVSQNIVTQNTTVCTSVFCEINTWKIEERGYCFIYKTMTLNTIPHF